MKRALLIALMLCAGEASALTLELPGPARRTEQSVANTRITLPVGPWAEGSVPLRTAEGSVTRTAWHLSGSSQTLQQILAPLRAQLGEAGYEVVFECDARACGGFDFRFALDLLPSPAMYVDLARYRYLLAQGPEGALVSLLVSRAAEARYVHLTTVLPADAAPIEARAAAAEPAGPVWDELDAHGRAVLDDLSFGTGASTLEEGEHASLRALADGLRSAPGVRIALVGHTDTQGGLEANIALSQRRAEAVRRELIDRFGVDPARVDARGVGYLAPRASNATEAGREANRRVEAVLTE